jgi:hypothetical protein
MRRLLGNLGLLISSIGLGIGCILLAFGNTFGMYILLVSAFSFSITTK